MPTYNYQCETHGEFEAYHSVKEELDECPQCKEEGLSTGKPKRLVSSGGNFILLGGGWSKDNYR